MKKLVLLLAVVFSASLFSCNNSKNDAAATDTVAVGTVEAVVLRLLLPLHSNQALRDRNLHRWSRFPLLHGIDSSLF